MYLIFEPHTTSLVRGNNNNLPVSPLIDGSIASERFLGQRQESCLEASGWRTPRIQSMLPILAYPVTPVNVTHRPSRIAHRSCP
jgi:hypothetical protein